MLKAFGIAAIAAAALATAIPVAAQHLYFGSGGVSVHFGDDDHDYHRGYYGPQYRSWHGSNVEGSVGLNVGPQTRGRYHDSYNTDRGNRYYRSQRSATYRPANPIEIEFGGYAHVADLSTRLMRLANDLCLELHYNYRHNSGFAAVYRQAYELLEITKYVQALENQANRDEIARRLARLDVAFHQIEGEIKPWTRQQTRKIGQGGAQTKLDLIGVALHDLMQDVGVVGVHGAPDTPPGPETKESAPPLEPLAAAPAN